MLREKLVKLAEEKNNPCVTISFNTHRTHPDSKKDVIELKNLCKEAENRLLSNYEKRSILPLLDKLENIPNEIDENYNLDSLHIFLSNTTKEIVKISFPTRDSFIQVADAFAIRPLIYAYNNTITYLILVISQSSVNLFEASNDSILEEIVTDNFPIPAPELTLPDSIKKSDTKKSDNLIREYFNRVDKAVAKIANETDLNVVVISTPENFIFLNQIADQPDIYIGQADIDYNNIAPHQLAASAYNIIKDTLKQERTDAIDEVFEAIPSGKVLTDLQEIFQAAKEGRGDLLLINKDFHQAVKMHEDSTFELVDKQEGADIIDDITSDIAWEVKSKNGRAYFTNQTKLKSLGDIALKVRY